MEFKLPQASVAEALGDHTAVNVDWWGVIHT